MAHIKVIDSEGIEKEIKADGVGSPADPFVFERFSMSMAHQIARNLVSGHSNQNILGKAPSGIQITATDFWDRADATPTQQIWVAPTQARIHDITSSSASDDGDPVGVGARTIRIWGLKTWDTAEVSEDIILNGVSNVPTANSYVIIHRMQVLTKGATNINVGIITATAQIDSTITAQINVGEGHTHMAIFGIPSIQKAYINYFSTTMLSASTNPATANAVDAHLLINPEPDTELTNFFVRHSMSSSNTASTCCHHSFCPPLEIAGPAIIKVQGKSFIADTDTTAALEITIVDN